MKNKTIKSGILALIALVCLSMPVAVSAQGFWDVFTSNYWYSVLSGDGAGPPNDDKKNPKPASTPAPPNVPDLPDGEYCRNEQGELVPCRID